MHGNNKQNPKSRGGEQLTHKNGGRLSWWSPILVQWETATAMGVLAGRVELVMALQGKSWFGWGRAIWEGERKKVWGFSGARC